MCYQKLFEIVFSLLLASERATSIGLVLVLVLFLFLDRVRGRDTAIFSQHILAFIHIREGINQAVYSNMIIVLPFCYVLFSFHFIFFS